jgi:hypothetical protein
MTAARAVAVILCFLFWSEEACAHERSESTSHWSYLHGRLEGMITIRAREITRLLLPGDRPQDLGPIFAAHVRQAISATVDGVPCQWVTDPGLPGAEPGFVRVSATLQCPTGHVLVVTASLLSAVAPSHHHFIYLESATATHEAILTHASASAELPLDAAAPARTRLLQFVTLGVEHILTGIDHLAFLLALLLGVRGWRQIVAIVSGFTLGHSLTLSLAVLGVVTPNRTAVECLIGLTIALAAAHNLLRPREASAAAAGALLVTLAMLLIPAALRPDMGASLIIPLAVLAASSVWLMTLQPAATPVRSRVLMASGFGLIHGLGFAGALQDLHLPQVLLLPTLLGFNVGVELGQLAVVAASWALLAGGRRLLPALRASPTPAAFASAVLLAAGVTWYLTRALLIA